MNSHYSSSTILVTNLVAGIDESFLRALFSEYGVSKSRDAVTIKTKIDRNSKPHKYAYIKFDTREQALEAVQVMGYTKLDNEPIIVYMADDETKNIIRSGKGKLVIKGLDPSIEESQIDASFQNFGEVIYCKIPKKLVEEDGYMRRVSQGLCYVQFRHQEDAEKAMNELYDASVNGKPITIESPTQYEEGTFTVCYIKNLPERFTDCDLKNLFSEYGNTLSCRIVFDENGKSKHFGFCKMKNHEEAVRAVAALNGREIEGSVISCSRALSYYEKLRKEKFESCKGRLLYVNNLDQTVTKEELREIFLQFGQIESLKMKRENGNSKQFCSVCYKTNEQAEECIRKSNLIMINRKQPHVEFA